MSFWLVFLFPNDFIKKDSAENHYCFCEANIEII